MTAPGRSTLTDSATDVPTGDSVPRQASVGDVTADIMTADTVTVRVHRWRTELSVTVRSDDLPQARSLARRLLSEEIERLERAASRFREDSELSLVNRRAGVWTSVSWYFVRVLTAAISAAEQTDGLVDPCVGHLVDAAGYRGWRDGSWPEPDPRTQSSRGLWQQIEVRPAGANALVRIPVGCQLDLGAIAKAWLADRLAATLADGWELDTIANMGGDLRAVGNQQPWVIAADPEIEGIAPSAMTVETAGLATSGRGKRRWVNADGQAAHHIIDPRTGRPARTPWWSVSVLAADARGANTAATAGMVLGQSAPFWLADRGLDAWLVAAPESAAPAAPPATLTLGRWPAAGEVPA